MVKTKKIIELENVVIKFAGDSGDGMQLTGAMFSDSSAMFGNDLSTFPDYPSEIRAPHGTIAGVSGFQVHIGKKKIQTPGDFADILVAMNPAALKANQKWLRPGSTVIIDADSFDDKNIELAGYSSNPLENESLKEYNIVKAPISSLSAEAASKFGLDKKNIEKTRNQFVVGILYWLFNRDIESAVSFIQNKFKKKPEMVEPNLAVLHAGFNFAENVEAMTTQIHVKPAKKEKGLFRNITGNQATAWGLLAAAERSGLKLFLGSYPITPASEILQELSTMKHLDCITFQAEDEIAGICSAIGASFAGHLGTTSTSGPGLALKGEAIGLAVMTELPLVIVNVQRGGPATGLPTKTEQSDLMQALYGRNGESPVVVMAATTPANCFEYAYKACKITLEHMTPVILLTDGYLANGSELWKIPDTKELPEITPRLVKDNDTSFKPYLRDLETLARNWAIPGQEGLRHRVGGLEKENITGVVSHDPANHQLMVNQRAEKVERVTNFIPDQTIYGKEHSDLLVIGWGGTYGALITAVKELQEDGFNISLCQFNYIQPLPKNTAKILANHKKRLVCELNMGQFANHLRTKFPHLEFSQYNKIQGLPFFITELKEKFKAILEGK